jgi:hypothetical protein
MKTVITTPIKSTEIVYPCLMEYKNNGIYFVVFFSSACSGVIVYGSGVGNPFGTLRDRWDMRTFKRFEGVVELSN